ncbi:Brp/Blh family beta-carotene 15,15'-dioxygenase [Candidatus Pelagibacter sp.]|nr:Brp/Blh family beta-carotene 15,15'-dioxygenase [Candidatus Pelagibacter sp.]
MNTQIKKINLNHSFIFFLFCNIFSVIVFKFTNLNISSLFCLLLILTVGVSHGALDHLKGKKLLSILNIKKFYIFYLIYTLMSLSVILIWTIVPAITLIVFLTVASFHFGKEDTQFLINKNSNLTSILYFFRGLLVIILPLYFNFDETVTIFKMLLINNEQFYSGLSFIEKYKLIEIAISLSALSSIILFLVEFNFKKFAIFLDFFSIIILNYYLSPLVAFTIYFCFLHSIRHTVSLALEMDNTNLNNGFKLFVKKAFPLTVLTAIFCLVGLYFLNNVYELNSAILKIIFIGLASLTFPHILLEYFLEKNEK